MAQSDTWKDAETNIFNWLANASRLGGTLDVDAYIGGLPPTIDLETYTRYWSFRIDGSGPEEDAEFNMNTPGIGDGAGGVEIMGAMLEGIWTTRAAAQIAAWKVRAETPVEEGTISQVDRFRIMEQMRIVRVPWAIETGGSEGGDVLLYHLTVPCRVVFTESS